MIKLAALFVLLHLAACQDKVDQYFQDLNGIDTVEGLKCSKLEGNADDCLACYPCDHERIKGAKKKVQTLAFTFSNCTKDQLCCILTRDLKARTNDNNCGKHNPQGDPRSRRASLRSVLEREYPWRAWVYSSKSDTPLCAASYIFFGVNALLATASCVSDHQASDLYVKFTKAQAKRYRVNNVVPYESFSRQFGGNLHDIALVMLSEKPDSHVKSVCLDKSAPLLGASCVIVSDSETYINTVVPELKRCKNNNITIENGVMCTYMVKGDYTPQKGAGLYCLDEHSETPIYTLYGIYQAEHSTGQVAVYTTVHKYTNWILKTTNSLSRKRT